MSKSRQKVRKEGGIALLIKQNFYFTTYDNYKTASFESIFVELSGQVNSNKRIIEAISRSANTNQLTFNIEFDNFRRSMTKGCASCILLGDYNIVCLTIY